MSDYILLDEAHQDVRDLRDYLIEKAGSAVSQRVVKGIHEECAKLAQMPGMGTTAKTCLIAAFDSGPSIPM